MVRGHLPDFTPFNPLRHDHIHRHPLEPILPAHQHARPVTAHRSVVIVPTLHPVHDVHLHLRAIPRIREPGQHSPAPALVRRAVDAFLAHPDPSVRAEAFGAACGWAGRDRGPWIAALAVPAGDAHLQDMRRLALFWCAPGRSPPAPDPTAVAGEPADLLPALLARGPADEDGAVCATALLAERRLPPAEALRLADRAGWR